MSWDALIFNGQDVPKSLDSVGKNWRPHNIGTPEQARSMISSVLVDVTWDASGNGSFDGDQYAIEFYVPEEEEQVDSIGVRVVGNGSPIEHLVNVCRTHDWVLFDNQEGDLVDLNDASADSWNRFRQWRDRVSGTDTE
ncbi:MAG: hypothetical protein QF732_10715 [Nitrospinaceae bacterium]|jgi:hypothetical protein|nr:hypothetical protein [Nitrospinaceae bacterium]